MVVLIIKGRNEIERERERDGFGADVKERTVGETRLPESTSKCDQMGAQCHSHVNAFIDL